MDFGAGDAACLVIEEAQIVLHKAHQPDLIFDLADADVLSGKDSAEVDLAGADADAPTSGHRDREVMQGVLDFPIVSHGRFGGAR
jgi:hypothetical protein